MLGRRWIALALFLVPAATAVTIHGEDGEPVQADCAGDGSGEQMHALDDGSLFFPGRGCQATFALPEGAEAPVLVTYRVTGHVGEICGLFLFDGAVEGRSELRCSEHDEVIAAQVTASRGEGTTFTVTWLATSLRFDNAYLCAIQFDGAQAPADAEACDMWVPGGPCLPGLVVQASPGQARLSWQPIMGTYYYNASATRFSPEPVRLNDADASLTGTSHTFRQPAGTYGYVVTAFNTDHMPIATYCVVEATVPPGSEVPFFGAAWMLGLALAGVLGAGVLLARRRQG